MKSPFDCFASSTANIPQLVVWGQPSTTFLPPCRRWKTVLVVFSFHLSFYLRSWGQQDGKRLKLEPQCNWCFKKRKKTKQKKKVCYFNTPSLSSAVPPVGTGDLLYQQFRLLKADMIFILSSHKNSKGISPPIHHPSSTAQDVTSVLSRRPNSKTFCSRPINSLTCSPSLLSLPHAPPDSLFLLNSVI